MDIYVCHIDTRVLGLGWKREHKGELAKGGVEREGVWMNGRVLGMRTCLMMWEMYLSLSRFSGLLPGLDKRWI